MVRQQRVVLLPQRILAAIPHVLDGDANRGHASRFLALLALGGCGGPSLQVVVFLHDDVAARLRAAQMVQANGVGEVVH